MVKVWIRRIIKHKKLLAILLLSCVILKYALRLYMSIPYTRLKWAFINGINSGTSTLGNHQSCKIPKLDPFHPDVQPYITYFTKSKCGYPRMTYVSDDGYLRVFDKFKTPKVRYSYVRRDGDFKVTYSDPITLDVDKGAKLTEDVVKVVIESFVFNYEEFHVYPVRDEKPVETKPKQREANELNIVFFMIDSMSHSCGERYLKKTIAKLKASPSSVILNGHTIVGDGTTAQLCAMFVGSLETDLPEGRRGFKNAKSLDRWPFIFKEFEKAGYETLYSEDSFHTNSFNFRLLGFEKPPTTKYLRPFWMAAKKYTEQFVDWRQPHCYSRIAFQYLRRYLKVYKDKPSFSYVGTSRLAHDYIHNVQLADEELVDLLKFFDDEDIAKNTVFVLFGDHGDRIGQFRSTITGKLEERLPFVSFTFPKWFPEKYPKEFRNFQINSDLLTSHFDIYSTLKHLQTFPHNKHSHKFGKSLFTNISRLDRSCEDAGILGHWCACVNYKPIAVNDTLVVQAANSIINYINKNNNKVSKGSCEILKLKKIERAGLVVPSSRVQKFSETFQDKTCDECGVKEAKVDFSTDTVEIVFVVSPSDGKYEGTAVYDYWYKQFTSGAEISRINVYGDQPACVAAKFPYLRPFCYCKR